MKKCLMILSLLVGSLQANEAPRPLAIDSECIDFDGKSIILTGHATIEHELGTVETFHAIILPDEESKKLRLAHIKMKDGVKVSLLDGGQLICSNADINYKEMRGHFWGTSDDLVIYKEDLKSRQQAPVPLEVKGREMFVYLLPSSANSSQITVSQIEVSRDVTVNYNQEFLATSDQGHYQRIDPPQKEQQSSQSNVNGIISLNANGEDGICQIHSKNGDLIHANQIKIHTVERQIEFEAPHGTLLSRGRSKEQKPDEIYFHCGKIIWNEPEDILTLSGQVMIDYKGVGKVTNPNEIKVYRELSNGQKQISFIESMGESSLEYLDEKEKGSHFLTTYERFILDQKNMQVHLESPKDASGKVIEGKQIHFTDAMGEIFADHAIIYYTEVNKELKPTKLQLTGDIYLFNRTSADKEDPGKFQQLAIADRVDYDINTQEMLFKANPKKRVLFFDKANNLQVSAPSVKIKRDAVTKKEAVQGIGDVRFSFIDKELKEIKKRFNLNDDLNRM